MKDRFPIFLISIFFYINKCVYSGRLLNRWFLLKFDRAFPNINNHERVSKNLMKLLKIPAPLNLYDAASNEREKL